MEKCSRSLFFSAQREREKESEMVWLVNRMKNATNRENERRRKGEEEEEWKSCSTSGQLDKDQDRKNGDAASDPACSPRYKLDKTEKNENIVRLDDCLNGHVQHHSASLSFSLLITRIGHLIEETKKAIS